jgi:hemolysin III
MGWVVLLATYPLASTITASTTYWLVARGITYTVGVVFFTLDALIHYSHCIWHLFAMAGMACHLMAVMS